MKRGREMSSRTCVIEIFLQNHLRRLRPSPPHPPFLSTVSLPISTNSTYARRALGGEEICWILQVDLEGKHTAKTSWGRIENGSITKDSKPAMTSDQ